MKIDSLLVLTGLHQDSLKITEDAKSIEIIKNK